MLITTGRQRQPFRYSLLLYLFLHVLLSPLIVTIEAKKNIRASVSTISRSITSATNIRQLQESPSRIIGGKKVAADTTYPWFVSIRSGGGICGGSLITPSVVLTAAHCSPDLVNSNSNSNSNSDTTTEVLVGAYYANGTTAERRICIKHVVHPNFTSIIDNPRVKAPLVNDFALCLLDRPVELEMKNYLLLINRQEYRPTPGSDVIAIGLGRTSDGRHAEVLQEVPMKVLSNESCYEVARDARKFQLWQGYDVDYQLSSDEILCAKDSNDDDDDDEKFHVDRDTCRGDSGGPLLQRVVRTITANNISTTEKNEEITDRAITTRTYIDYYHVGVISYGYKCATINLSGSRSQNGNDNDSNSNSNSNSNMYSYPSVYARTSSGFSFIRDVVCGTNIDLGLDEDAYFCKNKEDSSTSTSSATAAIIITNNTKRGPTKSSTSTTIPTPTMTPTKIESSPSTAPSSTISSLFSQSWCSIFFDC